MLLTVPAFSSSASLFFFFNDTATTEIYTLSLHDALPISRGADRAAARRPHRRAERHGDVDAGVRLVYDAGPRSEEHTSELQSRLHLVCRLLLEKKKKKRKTQTVMIQEGTDRYSTLMITST